MVTEVLWVGPELAAPDTVQPADNGQTGAQAETAQPEAIQAPAVNKCVGWVALARHMRNRARNTSQKVNANCTFILATAYPDRLPTIQTISYSPDNGYEVTPSATADVEFSPDTDPFASGLAYEKPVK